MKITKNKQKKQINEPKKANNNNNNKNPSHQLWLQNL